MINIKINDRIFEFPSGWDEMKPEEVLYLCSHLMRKDNLKLVKIAITFMMLNMRLTPHEVQLKDDIEYFSVVDKNKNRFEISAYAVDLVSEKLNFIFKEVKEKDGDVKVFVDSRLTRNPVPVFIAGNTMFNGPKQALSDISFGQFILSEHYYNHYMNTGVSEYLDKMIASLCCRTNEVFDESRVKDHADLISHLPGSRKLAYKLFYEGSKVYLGEKFPLVFSGKGKKNGNIVDGFMKVTNALSNNDVTKHEVIRATALYEVMYALNDLIDKNEKIKG